MAEGKGGGELTARSARTKRQPQTPLLAHNIDENGERLLKVHAVEGGTAFSTSAEKVNEELLL